MANSNYVKSVVKAFKIFEELVENNTPMTLSSVSNSLDINISTVHRLINTLVKLGYVEQNKEGLYKIGINAYNIADIIANDFDLKKIVHPYLKKIVNACNETCNLVALENHHVVYLDQIESTNMVRMFAREGSRGAAYCTGSGKALLANLDDKTLENYLDKVELKKFTENTITDKVILKKELQKIKAQGYALDLEEKERGVRCVAAPLFNKDKKLVAAISVSGPCARITEEYLYDTLIPLVLNTAAKVNKELNNKCNIQ
ncbi:MAG: IclR family transcriptional regulator [Halanaerobiaceae bacterium]